MEIVLAGETLRLLPDKALYWPRQQTLFIADAHFGKVAAFRAGIRRRAAPARSWRG
jgi:hypothetical protein